MGRDPAPRWALDQTKGQGLAGSRSLAESQLVSVRLGVVPIARNLTIMAESFPIQRLVLIASAWLIYFLFHSLLASLWAKGLVARHRPHWLPAYRLAFNALALALLIPPLWLTYGERGPWLWQWTGPAAWLANGLALLAILGVLYSLRWYQGEEFLGLRQWRGRIRAVADQEPFHLSPLHRWVRHPWYSLGLIMIWTRDMDPPLLVTALLVTLYLVLGSWLEEAKLIALHGDRYRRYRRLVPGLVPRPWHHMTEAQGRALLEAGEGKGPPRP